MLSFVLAAAMLIGAGDALITGEVELIGEDYTFTEGPLWLPEGRWIFSDVQADTIFYADRTPYRSPSNNANGLALDPQGRVIACERDRVSRTEKDGSVTVIADSYQGKRLNSPNDVAIRSDGTIFFTDPKSRRAEVESATGFSGVYAVPPQGGPAMLLSDDFGYPNGIALSPDEKTLYVSDTSGGHIRAFDLADDGTLSKGRVHCQVRIPDGIAVDADGRIWSSSSKGVVVFGADGASLGSVDFKGMPTNCAFGGSDGKTLLITVRRMVYKVQCVRPGLNAGRG